LLSSQYDGNYFTDANWLNYGASAPDPRRPLYSTLGKADELRLATNPTRTAQYLYRCFLFFLFFLLVVSVLNPVLLLREMASDAATALRYVVVEQVRGCAASDGCW
jgi:hypothetical protein